MNIFYQPNISDGTHFLDAEESRHCTKVLRKKSGDLIRITDGKGFFYNARIIDASSAACTFSIEETIAVKPLSFSIHIAIAPTKNADRMEWFVEKSVELGIHKITLLECHHGERSYLKTERLHKIATSAMKQSLKASLPAIEPLIRFEKFIDGLQDTHRFIAFVDTDNPIHLKDIVQPNHHYTVLIGPEGDFSEQELNFALAHGFTKVSLGPSRLRTETAGVAACHILNLVNN